MAKVLVSAVLPGPALDRLRLHHDVEVGSDPTGLGREGLLARIADAAAVITRVSDRVDEAVLDRAPSLRIVANCAVGVDNIDLAACRRRGIFVTNTPDVLTDATADFTFALILAACRRVAEGDRLVRAGGWRGFSLTDMLGVRVAGASLGIVGLGRIGRAVAERARGFSMRVRYTQRHRAEEAVERALAVAHVSLDALFAESDIVCLCCPLNDSTRGLVSRDRIARMKRGAVLVNTARGACVDSLAVAEALQSGHLSAAALDVYPNEPEVDPALLACENAVLTPHIASADRPTREGMASLAAESVIDVLAGRAPRHPVP
jgi:lactate dehydrogenase-like 2-hydroxyacid dehydrogenase